MEDATTLEVDQRLAFAAHQPVFRDSALCPDHLTPAFTREACFGEGF